MNRGVYIAAGILSFFPLLVIGYCKKVYWGSLKATMNEQREKKKNEWMKMGRKNREERWIEPVW